MSLREVSRKIFPRYIENGSFKGLAFLIQFFEKPEENVTFASLVRNEIPKMTNLALTDSVDAAKSLFEPVRIPGKIVVHHQVCALKVDTLASGIRGKENQDFRIVAERFLESAALFAGCLAVDGDDGILRP